MGIESPANSTDGNLEKTKTLMVYLDRLKADLERQKKLKMSLVTSQAEGKGPVPEIELVGAIKRVNSLQDESERLDALTETEGPSILEKPISEIITIFEDAKRVANDEYKELLGDKKLDDLLIQDDHDRAKELIDGVEQFDKMIARMIQFES